MIEEEPFPLIHNGNGNNYGFLTQRIPSGAKKTKPFEFRDRDGFELVGSGESAFHSRLDTQPFCSGISCPSGLCF